MRHFSYRGHVGAYGLGGPGKADSRENERLTRAARPSKKEAGQFHRRCAFLHRGSGSHRFIRPIRVRENLGNKCKIVHPLHVLS